MSEMIEFGKYKGKPVEVLAKDREYTDWLANQPWLKDRHPAIYNVIINNFGEPEETPEHNRLQARFMDDEFFESVLSNLFIGIESELKSLSISENLDTQEGMVFVDHPPETVERSGHSSPVFELNSIDVMFTIEAKYKFLRQKKPHPKFHMHKEPSEIMVSSNKLCHFRIELKPMVGDDYPAILREMVHKKCNLLIYENFRSDAIDEKLLEKFFATRKIKILSTKNLKIKNLLDDF